MRVTNLQNLFVSWINVDLSVSRNAPSLNLLFCELFKLRLVIVPQHGVAIPIIMPLFTGLMECFFQQGIACRKLLARLQFCK